MQNMNLPHFSQLGLPVPFHGVDQNTFNGNLPAMNDKVPPVQLSQLMMQNQQAVYQVIAKFRLNAQMAVNKGYLQMFCYNLLSQNGFQNPVYQQWAQTAVDFFEFLVVGKGYQPQQAIDMAAQRVMEAFIGMAFATYQQGLSQLVEPSRIPSLQTAVQIYHQITADIQRFKSGGGMAMNMGGAPMGGVSMGTQLPPISTVGGTPMGGLSNFATSSAPAFSSPLHSMSNNTPAATNTNNTGSAFYDDLPPAKPLQPVEEWGSGNQAGNNQYGTYSEPATMQNQPPQQPNAPVVEETNLPIPTTVKEVQIDPSYYQPAGSKPNFERPYDLIWNPGGIEIRPAHQTDWERTVGDDTPYSELHDPAKWCLFYVKFPDGAIKEAFKEWNPQMEYLRHELNDDLRRQTYRPSGVVYANDTPVSTVGGNPNNMAEVESMVKDGTLPETGARSPLILDRKLYLGATELEVEAMVRADVREILEVEDVNAELPAYEYTTLNMHSMDISDELYNELVGILSSTDMIEVATRLKELVLRGSLSIRYFRFLNERLTKCINDYMADSMSMSIDITDFCQDIGELLDYIAQKKGQQMLKILKDGGAAIIGKAATMVEVDGDRGVADQLVTFQTGWTLEQLSTLNILTEKAVLVSGGTHPTVLEILRGMISRSTQQERLLTHRLRIATLDGVYLEVIKGQLAERAVLLKRLK